MARSLKKGIYLHKSVLKELGENAVNVVTYSRASCVPVKSVSTRFEVYNGKSFLPLSVSPNMFRQRLGEFSLTRAVYKPKQKRKKQFRKKKKK